MKLTKRITSLILSLVMLVSLACTGAWTPHVHAEEQHSLDDMQFVHINPLYADTVTEDDLAEPERPSLYADNTDGEHYYDATSAGEMIRDDLVARDTTIVVDAYCKFNSQDTAKKDVEDLANQILAAAMVHTGNPVEGDYLLWQYAGYKIHVDAEYDENYIYATLTYTMTYYTSAEQEAAMDTAVNKLLGQLNVSGATTYNQLKAIYDYITSNVTYDDAHKNDESYKLKHTAYAALINKTAVCQGYALLLYRLALELGVDCRLIAGTAGGENHGWNIAKVGDYYYNLDATWDAGEAEQKYFLVSPKNFTNHTRWDEYSTATFHKAYPMAENDFSASCAHTYESAVTTKPTCNEKGVRTHTCSKCGYSYTEAVPSTGHSYQSVVTPPTCAERGYTTHTCTACGDSYQDSFVAAVAHSYDAGVVTKAATCTEAGVKTFTCSVCKNSYTETIPMIDHVYGKPVVTAPTCDAKGYTTHTCTACGDYYQDSFVDATGHSYGEGVVTKAATCSAAGIKTFTCATCKASYTQEIPMTDHVYDKTVVTAPTCDEKGYTTHTCSACGDYYKDSFVDATGHSYGEGVVTKAATCTEEGVKTFTCSVCKTSYTEVIPVTDHVYDKTVVTAPTCTEGGYTTHTCVCGDYYQNNFVDATGHDYGTAVITKAATCTEDGVQTYTCANCGDTIEEDIAALGHAYDDGKVITEATCTEYGTLTHTCARCENVINAYVDPLGHEYGEGIVTTEPTCTKEGVMTYPCIRDCGNTTTGPVPALGHTLDAGTITLAPTCTKEGIRTHKCTVCGETVEQPAPALGHAYDNGTVTTAPTCIKEGVKTFVCKNGCGVDVTEIIPVADHDFTDGTCHSCGAKAVVITTQPKTTYTQWGEVAKITVEAEGEGLTYKWYIKNAGQEKYSKSSVTGPTYSCRMSEKSKDRRVICIVTDKYGNKVQSKTVLVREALSIVTAPKTTYAKYGAVAKVKVEASGDGLTYKWYIKNAGQEKYSKSSVTGSTYSCKMSNDSKDRRVICIVTDKYGNKIQTKTVLIRMSATITEQPKSVTAKEGATAKATVKAVGDGLTYQWYIKHPGKENFTKSSVINATYSVTMSKKADGRQAYCVITDNYGKTVRSSTITFTMK